MIIYAINKRAGVLGSVLLSYCKLMATLLAQRSERPASSANGQSLLDHEDELEEDTFITFTTTESRCEQLYEKGLELKSQGQLEDALSCLLECLSKMQECQYFAKLAQTLHQLAELYHTLERYDKAVEFAQAEKLFYEAVIIDMQEKKENGTKKPQKGRRRKRTDLYDPDPSDSYGDLLILKADEYEKLARLCAQEKKFPLALDYCGKAVKIRQSVFGPDHPVTAGSLEYFTVLYAEVGRKQYAAALRQAEQDIEPPISASAGKPTDKEAFERLSSENNGSLLPLCDPDQGTFLKQDENHTFTCKSDDYADLDRDQQHDIVHSQNTAAAVKDCDNSIHVQDSKKPTCTVEPEDPSNYYFVGSPGTVAVRTLKSIPLWLIAFAVLAQLVIVVFFIR